jgi:hypothetical protein
MINVRSTQISTQTQSMISQNAMILDRSLGKQGIQQAIKIIAQTCTVCEKMPEEMTSPKKHITVLTEHLERISRQVFTVSHHQSKTSRLRDNVGDHLEAALGVPRPTYAKTTKANHQRTPGEQVIQPTDLTPPRPHRRPTANKKIRRKTGTQTSWQ